MSCGGHAELVAASKTKRAEHREVVERLRQRAPAASSSLRPSACASRIALGADEVVETLSTRRDPPHRVRAGAGRSPGRSGSRARPAGRGGRPRQPGTGRLRALPPGSAARLVDGHARSRARPARERRSGPRRRRRAPPPGRHRCASLPVLRPCSATTSCTASSASPARRTEVFPFFADAGNLEAITPPWLGFHVVTPRPIEMRAGALIEYRLRLHGLPIAWLTRIEEWVPGERFVDLAAHRSVPALAPHARVRSASPAAAR